MKFVFRYSGILALIVAVLALDAQARDLDQDEALRLRQEGVIRPLEDLMAPALGVTPGPSCWRRNWKRRMTCWSTRWSC